MTLLNEKLAELEQKVQKMVAQCIVDKMCNLDDIKEIISTIRSHDRKIMEEILKDEPRCSRTVHFDDDSCCDAPEERNQLRSEQRKALQEKLGGEV